MTSSAQCPEKAWILLSYNNFKFGGRSRHSIAMDPLSSNYTRWRIHLHCVRVHVIPINSIYPIIASCKHIVHLLVFMLKMKGIRILIEYWNVCAESVEELKKGVRQK